jgi:hypothetical protein
MTGKRQNSGGAKTNLNGLTFQEKTRLSHSFTSHTEYYIQKLFKKKNDPRNGAIINNYSGANEGILFDGYGHFNQWLRTKGIYWEKVWSKQLQPDGVILVGNTIYIIEQKTQEGSGSIDEKLQTCHFKKLQYEKLLKPLMYKVEFFFLLDDFFLDDKYNDVKKYIKLVGCDYFFDKIPLSRLGLKD